MKITITNPAGVPASLEITGEASELEQIGTQVAIVANNLLVEAATRYSEALKVVALLTKQASENQAEVDLLVTKIHAAEKIVNGNDSSPSVREAARKFLEEQLSCSKQQSSESSAS